MTDKQGRPYARLSTLKPGDKIIVDDGFAHTKCAMAAWSQHPVKQMPAGKQQYPGDRMLYISCSQGRHMLDGQLMSDNDSLVGIYRLEDFKP